MSQIFTTDFLITQKFSDSPKNVRNPGWTQVFPPVSASRYWPIAPPRVSAALPRPDFAPVPPGPSGWCHPYFLGGKNQPNVLNTRLKRNEHRWGVDDTSAGISFLQKLSLRKTIRMSSKYVWDVQLCATYDAVLQDAQDEGCSRCFLDCFLCLKHLEMVILSKCQEWSVTEMYPMTFHFHFECRGRRNHRWEPRESFRSSPREITLGVANPHHQKVWIINLWYGHGDFHKWPQISSNSRIFPKKKRHPLGDPPCIETPHIHIYYITICWLSPLCCSGACLCSRSLHNASSASYAATAAASTHQR